jgi:hypothetical protein
MFAASALPPGAGAAGHASRYQAAAGRVWSAMRPESQDAMRVADLATAAFVARLVLMH